MKLSNQENYPSRNNIEEQKSFENQKVYVPLRSKSRSPSYQATIRSPQNQSSQRNQISDKQDINSPPSSQQRIISKKSNYKSFSQQQSRQQLIDLKDQILRNMDKNNYKEKAYNNKNVKQTKKDISGDSILNEQESQINSSIEENGNMYVLTTQGGSASQAPEKQSSTHDHNLQQSNQSLLNQNQKLSNHLKQVRKNISNNQSEEESYEIDDSNRNEEQIADGNLTEPQIQSSEIQSRIKKNKSDNIIYQQQIQILQDFATNNTGMDTINSKNIKYQVQEPNVDVQQIPQKIKRYSSQHHTGGSFGNLNEMQLAMLQNQNKDNMKSRDYNIKNHYVNNSQQSLKPQTCESIQNTSSGSQKIQYNKKLSKIELKINNQKLIEKIKNENLKEYSETNHNDSNMTNKITQKDSFQQRIDSSIECEINKIESQTLQTKHRKILADNHHKNSLELQSHHNSQQSNKNKFIIQNNWYKKNNGKQIESANGSKKHSVMSKSSSSTTLGSILFKNKCILMKNRKRNNQEINTFDQQESNQNRLEFLESNYSGNRNNFNEFIEKISKKMKNEKQVAFKSNSIAKEIAKKYNIIDSLISPKKIRKGSVKNKKIKKNIYNLQKSINSRKSTNSRKSKKKSKSQQRSQSLDRKSYNKNMNKQEGSQKKMKSLSNPKLLKQSTIQNGRSRMSIEMSNNQKKQKNEKPPHKCKLNTIQYNLDSIDATRSKQKTQSQKSIHRQNNTFINTITKKSRSNSRAKKQSKQQTFQNLSIDQSIGQRLLYDIVNKYKAMEREIQAQGKYNINKTGNCQNIIIQTSQRNQMIHDIQLLANALIKSENKIIKDKSIQKINSKKLKEIIESQEQIMGLMQQKIDKMQGKIDKYQNQGEIVSKELSNERKFYTKENEHIKSQLKSIINKNELDKKQWAQERKTIIIEFEKELQNQLKQQKKMYEIELKTHKSENEMLKLNLKENKNIENKLNKMQNEYNQSIEILNEQQETIDQLKQINIDLQDKFNQLNFELDATKIESLKQIDLHSHNINQINNKFDIKLKKLKNDHENELNKIKVAKNMEEYTIKFQFEDKLNEKETKIQQLEQFVAEKNFIIQQYQSNSKKEKENMNQNEIKLIENLKQIEIDKQRIEYENMNLLKQIQNFQIIIGYKDKHIQQLNQNLQLDILGEKSYQNQENYIKELQSQIDNYIKVFKELHIQLRQQKMIEKENYTNTELEIKGYQQKIEQQQQEIQILAQGFQAQQAKLNAQKFMIENHSKRSTGQFNGLSNIQINQTKDYDSAQNIITFTNKNQSLDERFYSNTQTMIQNNIINSNTASLIGEHVIYDCQKPFVTEDVGQQNQRFKHQSNLDIMQLNDQNQEDDNQNTGQQTYGDEKEQSEMNESEYSKKNMNQNKDQNNYFFSQQNKLNADLLQQPVIKYQTSSNESLSNDNYQQIHQKNYISSEYDSYNQPFVQNQFNYVQNNVHSLQQKKRKNNPTFGDDIPQNQINQEFEEIDYPKLDELQNNTMNDKSKQYNPCFSSTLISRQEILSQKENSNSQIQQFNNQDVENYYQQQLYQKQLEKQQLLNIIYNIQRQKSSSNNNEPQMNEDLSLEESNSPSAQNIQASNQNILSYDQNYQIQLNNMHNNNYRIQNLQSQSQEQLRNCLSEDYQIQMKLMDENVNINSFENIKQQLKLQTQLEEQRIESQSTNKDKSSSQLISQNSQSNISNTPNLQGAFQQLSSGVITTSNLQKLKNQSFNQQFPATAIASKNQSQNKNDNIEIQSQLQNGNKILIMDEKQDQNEKANEGFESVNMRKYIKQCLDEELCDDNESSYNYLKESNNSLNSVNKKELQDAKQRIRQLIQQKDSD